MCSSGGDGDHSFSERKPPVQFPEEVHAFEPPVSKELGVEGGDGDSRGLYLLVALNMAQEPDEVAGVVAHAGTPPGLGRRFPFLPGLPQGP